MAPMGFSGAAVVRTTQSTSKPLPLRQEATL
jgi:hypothetical protein